MDRIADDPDHSSHDALAEEVERDRKRPRTALACEACRRRKSKCDVLSFGSKCHRCDQLGTACSLESRRRDGALVDQSPHNNQFRPPSIPLPRSSLPTIERELTAGGIGVGVGAGLGSFQSVNSVNQDREDEVTALRRRVRELEQSENVAARTDELQVPQSLDPAVSVNHYSPQTPTSSRPDPPADKVRDEAWYRGAADPEAFSLIHGGMGTSAEHGLRDPVADGIVTASFAEILYQIFKHNIAGILPYPTLLTTRSKLPSHPYLRSACLLYAARCFHDATMVTANQVRQLEVNLSQNLMAYHRGCRPSLESVFAGLIVSLLPHGQSDDGPSDFDPARMVGMSYGQLRELGHSVYIQRVVDTLRSGIGLSHIQQLLDDARLHFCIMTRVSWTNLSRCPNNDLPTALNSTHRDFTRLLRERGAMVHIDQHLMFEHEALDILMAQANAWHRLERSTTPTSSDLHQANDATRRAVQQMSDLRARAATASDLISLPWVLCQISYLKWWTTIRNIWFTYHLPTPLVVEDVQYEWIESLALGAQASADMIDQCLSEQWDLCAFPKAIATALILCFHTLSMAVAHLGVYFPLHVVPSSLDSSRLDTLSNHLSASCPTMQATLRRACTTLDEYRRQIRVQSRRPSNAGMQLDASAAPFSFNFVFDVDGRSVNPVYGDMGNGVVSHWDPFAELGNGWNWQQPPVPEAW